MIPMSNTDVFSLSPTIQELLGNSREILEHNKNMQQEIASLRFTVDRQAGEISALNATVKETRTPEAAQQSDTVLLSRKEAAAQLKVSLSSLWRYENSRQLIPKRIGGKLYYSQRDILERLQK